MPDYQKMYHILFNAVTDAVEVLEKQDAETARSILIQGQQRTEELYIESE